MNITVKLNHAEQEKYDTCFQVIFSKSTLSAPADLFNLMEKFTGKPKFLMYIIQTHCQPESALHKAIMLSSRSEIINFVCYALITENIGALNITQIESAIKSLKKTHPDSSFIASLQGIISARNMSKLDFFLTSKCYLNLSKAKLLEINLSRVNWSYANLWKINLSHSNLMYALLNNAILSETNLSYVILWYANLSGADMSGARLWKANLWRANLSLANLSRADFSEANLLEVNLSGTNLYKTIFISKHLFNELVNSLTIKDLDLQKQSKSEFFKTFDSLLAVLKFQNAETQESLKLAFFDNLNDLINEMVKSKLTITEVDTIIDIVSSHELFKDYKWKSADFAELPPDGQLISALHNNLDYINISTKIESKPTPNEILTNTNFPAFSSKEIPISQKSPIKRSLKFFSLPDALSDQSAPENPGKAIRREASDIGAKNQEIMPEKYKKGVELFYDKEYNEALLCLHEAADKNILLRIYF